MTLISCGLGWHRSSDPNKLELSVEPGRRRRLQEPRVESDLREHVLPDFHVDRKPHAQRDVPCHAHEPSERTPSPTPVRALVTRLRPPQPNPQAPPACHQAGLPHTIGIRQARHRRYAALHMRPVASWMFFSLTAVIACNGPTNAYAPTVAPNQSSYPAPPPPTEDIAEVASGGTHTCARKSSGRVVCWGLGQEGQLGSGSLEATARPEDVAGLNDATALALGEAHSCALRQTGQVMCWGRNTHGQLGSGSLGGASTRPTLVTGLQNVQSLTAGSNHTCAILESGQALCWGDNRSRQLGPSRQSAAASPVDTGLTNAQSIAAGDQHTCASLTNAVVCWGDGRYGQLGSKARTSAQPKQVPATDGAIAIAAGTHHTCALRADRSVVCWGDNRSGQLNGQAGASSAPIRVNVPNTASLTAGSEHTCARSTDGRVRCWGNANQGRLGNGSTSGIDGPSGVSGLSGVRDVAAGLSHTCVATNSGVQCWGRNDYGTLGTGVPGPAGDGLPRVDRLTDAVELASGEDFTCARRDDGSVWCWGRNDKGQTGQGQSGVKRVAGPVVGLANAVSVSTGQAHACATLRDGSVRCWGQGDQKQRGDSRAGIQNRPSTVSSIRDALTVDAGDKHTCIVRRSGEVACFGDNNSRQTGASTGTVASTPVSVSGLRDAVEVSVGGQHSCARRRSGSVMCWGSNRSGQLGNNAGGAMLSTPQPTPQVVGRLSDAAQVASGEDFSCARRRTGQAVCWGSSQKGQLGAGISGIWSLRVPVRDLTGAVDLATGSHHACAALSSGAIRCWGDNSAGQISPDRAPIERIPVPISGVSGAIGVTAGARHTCALLRGGQVTCWGDNTFGQQGTEVLEFSPTPRRVVDL